MEVRPGGVIGTHAWTIYIDDFAELEDVDFCDLTKLQGTMSPELESLLDHYDRVGLPGTIDCQRVPRTKILGEDVNGALGRRDLPSLFQAGLFDMVAWAGSQPRLSLVARQVVQGRLNRRPDKQKTNAFLCHMHQLHHS